MARSCHDGCSRGKNVRSKENAITDGYNLRLPQDAPPRGERTLRKGHDRPSSNALCSVQRSSGSKIKPHLRYPKLPCAFECRLH